MTNQENTIVITDDLTDEDLLFTATQDPYRMVKIKWNDTVYKSGWSTAQELEEMRDKPLLEITSVGYLIHDGEDRIILGVSTCNDNNQTGDHLVIPKSVVLSIKDLIEESE